jgi:hypothetical protein
MAIGDLYNANNVVVGQAAVFFAPKNTPLPSFFRGIAPLNTSITGWNQADPFDAGYFTSATVAAGGATSFTLTFTLDGKSYGPTSALTVTGLTAAAIQSAIVTALVAGGISSVLANNSTVSVAGTTTTGPWSVVMRGALSGGSFTLTPTGGTPTVTNPLWVPCGATDQGWQFGAAKSTQSINIEEQSTPVAMTVTSQQVTLAASLSEDITRTLNLALNATSAFTAPATGIAGNDVVTLTDNVLNYAVAMVSANPEGFGRIVYAPAWTQLANASVNLRRASDKRMYGVQFETVCATQLIQITNFTVAGL